MQEDTVIVPCVLLKMPQQEGTILPHVKSDLDEKQAMVRVLLGHLLDTPNQSPSFSHITSIQWRIGDPLNPYSQPQV